MKQSDFKFQFNKVRRCLVADSGDYSLNSHLLAHPSYVVYHGATTPCPYSRCIFPSMTCLRCRFAHLNFNLL